MSYPYVSTISGKHYYLATSDGKLTQDSSPVDIEDIAHHLAHITRFTGATTRSYTVAEHSLLCASMAEASGYSHAWQLACLLHDAHEAYLNDMATPMKHAMRLIYQLNAPRVNGQAAAPAAARTPWDLLEEQHQAHVLHQLGLAVPLSHGLLAGIVKKIDLLALAHEKAVLGPRDPMPWACLEGVALSERWLSHLSRRSTWNRRMLITSFLDRYYWLQEQVNSKSAGASLSEQTSQKAHHEHAF